MKSNTSDNHRLYLSQFQNENIQNQNENLRESGGYDFSCDLSNNNSQFSNVYSTVQELVCEISPNGSCPDKIEVTNSNLTCFNCLKKGHVHQNCLIPRIRIFCYSFYKDGVRPSICPVCMKKYKSSKNYSKNFPLNKGNSQQGGR